MFIDLVTLGAFLVICLLVFLIGDTISGGRRTARSAIDAQPGRGSRSSAAVRQLKRSLAAVIPQSQSEVDTIERDLRRAGYYQSTALIDYLSTRNMLMVAIAVTTGALAVAADPAGPLPKWILMGGLVTMFLGYGIPRLVLRVQANRRVDRIHQGLPDALDIVRMCVTAGLPLRDAFQRVSSEIGVHHPTIAVEFEVICRHADADTMANALRQFSKRIDTPEVNALAGLVSQTERMGTHVATAVTEFADSVRLARRQRASERANKTSIKLLFPVVLCLAPPIYVLMLGPPMLRLRNFVIEGHQPGGVLEVPRSMEEIRQRQLTRSDEQPY